MICQAPRDKVEQSSDFFYGCNFSKVIWDGAQITKLFWTQNNVLSSMYTWNKNKFPCDLFPRWLYSLVKKFKIAKKSCIEKNASHIHMEILTDAQKVTREKRIILEKLY